MGTGGLTGSLIFSQNAYWMGATIVAIAFLCRTSAR
jgi:hypothetical protein